MKPFSRIILLLFLCLNFAVANAQLTAFTKKAVLPRSLRESSGIECIAGKLWSFEDSGNSPSIFSLDSNTGVVLQQVNISNFKNTDWEDIAYDSNYIYIGDFGNNDGNRKDLRVLRIARASIDTSAMQSVTAEAINYSYPDQTSFVVDGNNNFDCEALLSFGDSLYLFTKNHGNFQSRLYSLPKTPGTYSAHLISQYDVKGKITAAAINPSNNQVALLGYQNSHFGSFILFLNGFVGNDFFSGTKKRLSIVDNTIDWQTEGLAYITDERLVLTCESSTAFPASLYAGDYALINDHVLSAKQITEQPAGAITYPNPSNGQIFINQNSNANGYRLYNMQGVLLQQGILDNTTQAINTNNLPAGIYTIAVQTPTGTCFERVSLVNTN
jgi:hypothetical protein